MHSGISQTTGSSRNLQNKLHPATRVNLTNIMLSEEADTDDYMFYDFAYTKHKKRKARISLVVQWLRICLPVQGIQVQSHPGRLHMPRGN